MEQSVNVPQFMSVTIWQNLYESVEDKTVGIRYCQILNKVLCLEILLCHTTHNLVSIHFFFTPARQMFSGVYWNKPVCPSVCPSVGVFVCVQNTTFCQIACGGIKSHSVTALVC